MFNIRQTSKMKECLDVKYCSKSVILDATGGIGTAYISKAYT